MPPHLAGSQELDLVIYRVVQEALTNVVRHAKATTADVVLREDVNGLRVTIADDGSGHGGIPGTGMMGMAERARLVRGRLDVDSVPGSGTTVALTVPQVVMTTAGATR